MNQQEIETLAEDVIRKYYNEANDINYLIYARKELVVTAISAALNTYSSADGWVRVEERLPENHSYVLALKEDGVSQSVVRFSDYDTTYGREFSQAWFCNYGCKQYSKKSITHWRNLPTPPQTIK